MRAWPLLHYVIMKKIYYKMVVHDHLVHNYMNCTPIRVQQVYMETTTITIPFCTDLNRIWVHVKFLLEFDHGEKIPTKHN